MYLKDAVGMEDGARSNRYKVGLSERSRTNASRRVGTTVARCC
jgi:hypothetical protein